MKFLFYAFFLSTTLLACNCHHEGNGYIYALSSNQPLAGVRIEVASGVPGKDTLAPSVYTDDSGYFAYSHDYCVDLMSAALPNYIGNIFSKVDGDTLYLEYKEGNGVSP